MAMKLIELVRDLDEVRIVLPIMQRSYVWKPRKVEDLFDSLYQKWPIGAFYLWQATPVDFYHTSEG
jgi:uncharacterized protein with ParB-like and HNH nuclease domain